MEQLGISPKQKERAQQTFLKSATYAGFIDPGTGRFVKPGVREEGSVVTERTTDQVDTGGSGGGGEPPRIDPIIQGLLSRLPKSGDVWPIEDRKLWLQLLEGSFKLIYRDKPESEADARSRRYAQEIADESSAPKDFMTS